MGGKDDLRRVDDFLMWEKSLSESGGTLQDLGLQKCPGSLIMFRFDRLYKKHDGRFVMAYHNAVFHYVGTGK